MRSTLPTGLSSSSARRRCSSVACGPFEITLMAWSTMIGALDMTRTTGTSPFSRWPMKAVVMPAATEMTSRSSAAGTNAAISSSSAPMSCGLTARTRVPATLAASVADGVGTPYRSRSSAARSGRRVTAATSAAGYPASSRPDSSASPILPVPRIAIMWVSPLGGRRDQGAQEEGEVTGPLGQAADQVAVPVVAVRVGNPGLVRGVGQPLLLHRPDAVQHLVLEPVGGPPGEQGQRGGDVDQPRVVRGQHRVTRARHQQLQAPDEGQVDVVALTVGHVGGLVVGPLAQPDPGAAGRQPGAVRLGAPQPGLDHAAEVGEILPQFLGDAQGRRDGGVFLRVQGDGGPGVPGRGA